MTGQPLKTHSVMFSYPVALFALALALAVSICSQSRSISAHPRLTSTSQASQADIARGKYLVDEVARCTECHSPHLSSGAPDPARYLTGAPIWIRPTVPISNWADRAPALAGFPGYSDEQAAAVLERGQGLEGEPLRLPMHPYHLHHDDAMAIVAYLRSLPPATTH